MARKKQSDSAAQTLDALESRGDKLAEWIGTNPLQLLAGAGAILLIAGGYGTMTCYSDQQSEISAAALSELEGEYRQAMGAQPAGVA